MRLLSKIITAFICLISFTPNLSAQLKLGGTVYDSSRINLVEGVRVVSTGGLFTMTDSLGKYNLTVSEKDSVSFIYHSKPTQKFVVKDIPDPSRFNIALHITVKGKYTTLKEVVVHTRSYRQDSLENRNEYADVFGFHKPTLSTSIVAGVVGADVDELINIFRFKRNKRLKAFQNRLEMEEQEKYINYRFRKILVKRVTQLDGAELDTFMIRYRPTYEFVSMAGEQVFNQYLLDASYDFKRYQSLKGELKKE